MILKKQIRTNIKSSILKMREDDALKPNKKIIISIILVIIWMIVIFIFSAMSSDESNEKSKGVISKVVEKVETKKEEIVNTEKTNIVAQENTNKQEQNVVSKNDNSKTYIIVNKLNTPLRKCAHASVYFVLCIFISNVILEIKSKFKLPYCLISIGLCFLYACTDEFHQSFVNGRTGQFTDVLIDTSGAVLGCAIFYIIYKLRHRKSKKVREEVL